jgi:molecular chaperone DnaK (HSP70)
MQTGYFIRDTFIKYDTLNSLPEDKKQRIEELTTLYNSLGYIDARYNLGDDQIRRMTDRQKTNLSNIALAVFEIESEIKELIKPDEQIQKELKEHATKQRNDEIQRLKYRMRDIETYLQKKLNSPRENPTKKEYRELQNKLSELI